MGGANVRRSWMVERWFLWSASTLRYAEDMKGPESTPPAYIERAERYALMAQVRVRRSDIDYVLDVIDISLSGALIDLGELARPKWLKVRQEVLLTLLLDGEQQELTGEVVRIVEDLEGSRFAIRYTPKVVVEDLRQLLMAHGRSLPPPLPGAPGRRGG